MVVAHRSQQRGGLADGEAEILGTNFVDPVADPQPAKSERRVDAGGQHQCQLRRAEIDQLLDAAVHAGGVDQVVVVDHDDQPFVVVDERVHDGGHDHPIVTLGSDGQRRHAVGDVRPRSADRADERCPEPCRIGVAFLHL